MHIRSFADFWPDYVRAHAHERTRVLHAVGSVLAVVMLGLAFAVKRSEEHTSELQSPM